VLGGQVFEIGGVVLGGEGVDLAALGLEDAGELLGPQGLGAAEHQVLEEVRDAGDARQLMPRAHLVMNLQGDDGEALVGKHQEGEAVVQGAGHQVDFRLPGRRVELLGWGHVSSPAV
jgi:hypothetical protein